jgi:hypothetical protein
MTRRLQTTGRRPEREFLRDWTLHTLAGEVLGFLAPSLAGASGAAAGAPDAVFLPLMVAAGAVEGAVLGWFQSAPLLRRLPSLRRRDWVGATSGGAALAWTIGMSVGASYEALRDLPDALLAAGGAALAALFLGAIGFPQ